MVETYPGGNLADRTVINTYDEANRLTQEEITTGAVVVATDYTYDNAHNRITKVVTDDGVVDENLIYSHNNLNQITSYYEDDNNNDSHDVGEALFSFTYDKNGNRISKDDGSATDTLHYYDRENRLIEVVTGTEHTVEIYAGSSASGTPLAIANYTTSQQSSYNYLYDYRTRRVLRDESDASGVATQINYSGGLSIQELTETTPGSGTFDNLLVEYIRGSDYGGGVGGILYSLRSSAPSYYHYNGRGDVTAKTNASGTLGYQAAYEAFGKHDNANASSEEWGTNVDRQQHSTKEEDPTGLQYFHNRYYDIETGTFITRDPLGFVDGPNVYAYVVQNPWTKFDPLGLYSSEELDKDVRSRMSDEQQQNYNSYTAKKEEFIEQNSESSPSPFMRSMSDENFTKAELSARDQYDSLRSELLQGETDYQKSLRGQTEDFFGDAWDTFWDYPGNPGMAVKGVVVETSRHLPEALQGAKHLTQKASLFFKGLMKADDGRIALHEGDSILAVVKNGKILDYTGDIMMSHEKFVKDGLGKVPAGAEVVTIGKHDGQIFALTSKTIHGTQGLASEATEEAAKATFR